MDTREWQNRLENTFTEDGVVGRPLGAILAMEADYARFTAGFRGHAVLMDAFQGFFVESLNLTQVWTRERGWPKSAHYAPVILYFVTLFRTIRACQCLQGVGYPLVAYALMRDLKDRILLLGAIARRLTTLEALHSGGRQARMREEQRVFKLLLGEASGLSAEHQAALSSWQSLFHDEVHGSKLTFYVDAGEWIDGRQPLAIGPTQQEKSLGMYMNRAAELGWLITRLLPYLQPEAGAFGPAWDQKRRILDDSFQVAVQALADMGKPIGSAFIAFANLHFSFREAFCFTDPDTEVGEPKHW